MMVRETTLCPSIIQEAKETGESRDPYERQLGQHQGGAYTFSRRVEYLIGKSGRRGKGGAVINSRKESKFLRGMKYRHPGKREREEKMREGIKGGAT